MNAEALNRSLSFLPDSMIEEAICSRAKKRIHFTPWLRAAACIAVVLGLLFGISFPWLSGEKYITAPSILAVKAYAFENEWKPSEYILKEGVTAYDHGWLQDFCFTINCVAGFPITFSFSEDREEYQNLVLELSVNKGIFIDGSKDIDENGNFHRRENRWIRSKEITTWIDRTVYWHEGEYDDTGKWIDWAKEGYYDDVYIEVLIRDGENIVGYAVLNMAYRKTPVERWQIFLIKSVYYPKILGRYQNVSEEYVRQQIEAVKQTQQQ